MDTLRGNFDSSDISDDSRDYDVSDEDSGRDVPPPSIGQDERRMQVRAYNFWAGMLDDRNYPSIEELDPASNEDFGPYGVLLDFSVGIEDPAVQFLGDELAKECGTDDEIRKLSDVPPRSLLSRITDHYMQILANQAPIGFEAEFVNQRGNTVLYRGILLPFSSDDETIDFIYGVINWKEMAEAAQADELLLEIDQALEANDAADREADNILAAEPAPIIDAPLADGPGSENDAIAPQEEPVFEGPVFEASGDDFGFGDEDEDENVEPIGFGDDVDIDPSSGLPTPAFGDYDLGDEEDEEEDEANYDFASLTDHIKAPVKKALSLDLGDEDEEPPVGYDIGYEHESFGAGVQGANDGQPAIPTAYEPEHAEDSSPEDDTVEIASEDAFAGPIDEPADPLNLTDEAETSLDDYVGDEPLDLAGFASESEPVAAEAPVEPLDLFNVVNDETAEETAEAEQSADIAIEIAEREPVEIASVELDEDAGLYDYLASARELAQTARSKEDRSRQALYVAVGRAYDFSLAAQESPAEYEELIAENGLAVQDRAPMTPVVKLVFGADYDKTRLTEYAAVLSHAHRVGVERGALSSFLSEAEGGLKGVVKAERQIRREEAGKDVDPVDAVRKELAKKLRELEAMTLGQIDPEGAEFSVVMLHRTEDGEVLVLGEVDDDIALIEKVGRKLVA